MKRFLSEQFFEIGLLHQAHDVLKCNHPFQLKIYCKILWSQLHSNDLIVSQARIKEIKAKFIEEYKKHYRSQIP